LFEGLHAESGWAGSAGDFGRAAAILLGDLLLGWSDELLDEGLSALPDRDAARAARAEFIGCAPR
jgi:geranylgeranyl diphosphate synthase type I